MASHQGRNITVNVTERNLRVTSKLGLHQAIEKALGEKGYVGSYVGDAIMSISTRSGNRWHANLPKGVTKKLMASSSLKARPSRLKPFSFIVRIFRGVDFNNQPA